LDPTSYKEPTWLIELKKIIQTLIVRIYKNEKILFIFTFYFKDKTFLNKTIHDDSSIQTNNLSTCKINLQIEKENFYSIE
jgi:hypothetical protein